MELIFEALVFDSQARECLSSEGRRGPGTQSLARPVDVFPSLEERQPGVRGFLTSGRFVSRRAQIG